MKALFGGYFIIKGAKNVRYIFAIEKNIVLLHCFQGNRLGAAANSEKGIGSLGEWLKPVVC